MKGIARRPMPTSDPAAWQPLARHATTPAEDPHEEDDRSPRPLAVAGLAAGVAASRRRRRVGPDQPARRLRPHRHRPLPAAAGRRARSRWSSAAPVVVRAAAGLPVGAARAPQELAQALPATTAPAACRCTSSTTAGTAAM
ncbi:MAG: hypothetical protein MZW92_10620 [Comamonadaceae bacterium]|nr:hypothetical protein [Comamonadaceae bacterium]